MWKCTKCNSEIDGDLSVCSHCGANKAPDANPVHTEEHGAQQSHEFGDTTHKTAADMILDRMSASVLDKPVETFEVHYSKKAFRSRQIFLGVISLILVAICIYLAVSKCMGDYYTKPMLIGIGSILAILWIYFLVYRWYKTTTISYRLTESNLYAQHGFFKRTTDSLEVISIDDLRMYQTLFDRILNGGVGTILVYSKTDKTNSILKMNGLEDPDRILQAIEDARRRRRSMRGIMQL